MADKTSPKPQSTEEPEFRILVVGDWVVDDHWVIGTQRSPTSSRTGQAHYRALHSSLSNVESLCGAGRTASVLHQAREKGRRLYDVSGIGIWHPTDTGALAAMLSPAQSQGHTPHRLTRTTIEEDRAKKLFNLYDILHRDHETLACGTTRMIRIYQQTGAEFSLLQRIDWELQIPAALVRPQTTTTSAELQSSEEIAWITEENILDKSELHRWLEGINAVVLKDLHKGVVSAPLVRWLARQIPRSAPWFVSTKSWHPSWFTDLGLSGEES